LAPASAGSSSAAKMAMMAMTTSSSIKVKPLRLPHLTQELMVFIFVGLLDNRTRMISANV
jgi:hypothetical protein